MPKKTAPPKADPTLPTRTVAIDGKEYTLCLEFGALMDAEEDLIRAGHDVSLLTSLDLRSASALRRLFPIAIHRFHPEIDPDRARAMITPAVVFTCRRPSLRRRSLQRSSV